MPRADASSQRDPALLRVVLADDHPLWRSTLKAVLDRSRFAVVVGEAGNGSEVVEVARATAPDVVVMDIAMPTVDGIEATRQLLTLDAPPKVLVLSSSDERDDVSRALKAGAAGYLLKTADSADIRDAVKRVAAGELVLPPNLAAFVLAELRGEQPAAGPATAADPTDQLTDRERQILQLMAEGCSNQAIADRLHVSPKTVEAHSSAIFSKLGVDASPAAHRRVLAVVTYLDSVRARTD